MTSPAVATSVSSRFFMAGTLRLHDGSARRRVTVTWVPAGVTKVIVPPLVGGQHGGMERPVGAAEVNRADRESGGARPLGHAGQAAAAVTFELGAVENDSRPRVQPDRSAALELLE